MIAYQIRDATGNLVAIHERHDGPDGKEFVWKQPDGSAGLRGTPAAGLPLYRSESLEESAQVVVVAEGERAADAIAAAGFHALGTTCGAASTPSLQALEVLRGRDVVLWPDADDVGRKHMTRIAGLLEPVARRILWVDPSGRATGWDAADADAATLGTLVEHAHELPTLAPEPADLAEPPIVWTVGDLAALPSAEEEYIIAEGILTRGGKLLIYAKSGAGKTTLLDFLAGPLSTGRPFLGRYAIDRERRVLVIQGELSIPEMSSHAQQLVAAGFTDDRLMFTRMIDLRLPNGEAKLRKLIDEFRAEIVALDPWYRMFSGESSDKPEQVGVVFDVCDRLLEDELVEAVIVVHHANVTGLRTAGSWLFEGWPSTIMRLETVAGVPAQRILTFEKIRAPSSSLLGERVAIALGDAGYLPVAPTEAAIGAGVTLARLVVAEAGGQLHRKELIARLMVRAHVKERAANKYLGQAVQARHLRAVPDGAEKVYQLTEGDGE